MQEVLRCVSPGGGSSSTAGTGTQTEIIAVHTPQDDHSGRFPYQRPSTLPLLPPQSSSASASQQSNQQLTSYADNLVDGVLKNTVTQNQESCSASGVSDSGVNDCLNDVDEENSTDKKEDS